MITSQQLIDKLLNSAQAHQPSMSPTQLKAYVMAILADELCWAFNNDEIVAKNVKQRISKLVPREIVNYKIAVKSNKARLS